MSDIIQGRNGERIPISEYPPGFIENLNDRLNGIAGVGSAGYVIGQIIRAVTS